MRKLANYRRSLEAETRVRAMFGGMTANERRLGRFIRDGEGHPDPTPAVEMVDVPVDEPASEAEKKQEPVIPNVDDLYDQEFGGVEPATPEADDGDKPEEVELPEEPEGGSAQERIDEITAARREAERAAAAEKRRADDLEARLAELEKAAAPKPPVDPNAKKERSPDQAPDPQDYEFGEADGQYIADHAAFHALKAVSEREQAQAVKSQLENIETAWSEAIAEPTIAEQYPDFETVVTKGAETKAWACSPIMALLVKSSEVGPDVAYHLASNPDESRRIAALDQNEQVHAIGRLEGRFLAKKEAAASSSAAPSGKKVTDAPAPPPSRSRGSGGQFQDAQSAAYEKMLREFN